MNLVEYFHLVDHVDTLQSAIIRSDQSINSSEIDLINEQFDRLNTYTKSHDSTAMRSALETLRSRIYTIEVFRKDKARSFDAQLLELRQKGCREDAVVLAAEQLQLPPTEATAYVDNLKENNNEKSGETTSGSYSAVG